MRERIVLFFSTRDLKTCLKLTNKSELVTNNCQSGRFADVISTNDEILVLDGTDLIPSKVKGCVFSSKTRYSCSFL